ncbi:MAG: O-antigen ligase family protein [Actinomycetota bacterium]
METALGGVAHAPRRKTRRWLPAWTSRLNTLAVGTAPNATRWEVGLAIVALFALGRTPVLFLRERMADLFGGTAGRLWPDDAVMRGTFVAVEVAVLLVAMRRSRPSTLLRQPLLLAFLGVAWASLAWSERPSVTVWRVSLFVGVAIVGWYIGHRFTLRQQVQVVAGVGAVAVATTLIALVAWPELARTSAGVEGQWSGMYVNRQLLGPVLCLGLIAAALLLTFAPHWMKFGVLVVAAVGVFILYKAGNRTGPVALVVAAAIAGGILVVRRPARTILTVPGGAVLSIGMVTIGGGLVSWHWTTILNGLGRRADLTSRTEMWAVDRHFLSMRPITGWGFETIWANPITIQHARAAFGGRFPYSSHSGYYEILLGVGYLGFAIFVAFLVFALWRSFLLAWRSDDVVSIWPLAMITFSIVANLSESFFASGQAIWALTVAAAVAATECGRPTHAKKRAIS